MSIHTSFVLNVSDLGAERAFYRDVVGLGDPVLNSNVWVEFDLGSGCSFCLEKTLPGKSPAQQNGRTSFLFVVDSVADFDKRYREHGFEGESVGIPCEHLGMHARQYPDPEGNLFRVTDSRLR